jgi:hypothetical protein
MGGAESATDDASIAAASLRSRIETLGNFKSFMQAGPRLCQTQHCTASAGAALATLLRQS